jgi:hypothetical protein
MPTFIILLNRVEIGRIQGADPNSLLKLINDGVSQKTNNAEHIANVAERQWLGQFVRASERVCKITYFQNYLKYRWRSMRMSLIKH